MSVVVVCQLRAEGFMPLGVCQADKEEKCPSSKAVYRRNSAEISHEMTSR